MIIKYLSMILLLLSMVEANPIKSKRSPLLMKREELPLAEFLSCTTTKIDTLEIEDGIIGSLSCKLNSQPKGDVIVSVDGDGLRFSECTFAFTPENWNSLQAIEVTAPSCIKTEAINSIIKFYAYAEKDTFHLKQDTLKVIRQCKEMLACLVYGDPHIGSLNRKDHPTINYQGVGGYMALHSDAGLQVQVYTKTCYSGMSCVYKTTIQYGDSVVEYAPVGAQDPTVLPQYAKFLEGSSKIGVSYRFSGTTFILETEKSASVVITFQDSFPQNISIYLPYEHYQKVRGWCGPMDDKFPNGQMISRTNEVTERTFDSKKVEAWAESWKLKDDESHINGHKANFNVKFGLTSYKACPVVQKEADFKNLAAYKALQAANDIKKENASLTEQLETLKAQYKIIRDAEEAAAAEAEKKRKEEAAKLESEKPTVIGNTIAALQNLLFNNIMTPDSNDEVFTIELNTLTEEEEKELAEKCPESFKTEADDICAKLLDESAGCESIDSSSRTSTIESCTADAIATCSHDFTEAYRKSYAANCAIKASLLAEHPDLEQKLVAAMIQEDNGFGVDLSCPNSCTSPVHGKCLANGCNCNPGYSGADCKMKLSALTEYSKVIESGSSKSKIKSSAKSQIKSSATIAKVDASSDTCKNTKYNAITILAVLTAALILH